MGRIEHYRNVCRDLETRLVKESEKFDEAVARKSALQDEINEIEARIAEEESRAPPGAPAGICGWGELSILGLALLVTLLLRSLLLVVGLLMVILHWRLELIFWQLLSIV